MKEKPIQVGTAQNQLDKQQSMVQTDLYKSIKATNESINENLRTVRDYHHGEEGSEYMAD